uniref:Chloroplast lumen common family protein n=1 Tax=Kalanchoe fedtschenkoi TaxID=63787 RepID=A0A7N0ZYS5_KALFE
MGCWSVDASSSIFHRSPYFTYLKPTLFTSTSSTISSLSFPPHGVRPCYNQISEISHVSGKTTSCIRSPLICCHSPRTHNPKILLKKIAVLVTGSVLLMGCLCRRPALALPGLRGHLSENIRHGRNEEVDDVEMKWERFLEGNPKDVEALKIVLYGKMRKGKPAEAVKYVERLIQLEGDEVEWRLLQALCYEMMGHFTTAKRLFKDILKGKPLLLRALHGLAMVMHKNNEGPAVFEMLNKALELSRREKRVTEERNISILIAQMHVVKGELEEGLTKFQGLIDENPRDFRPYLCQGIILSLLNRKEEAEQQFNTYRTLVPEEFPQRRFLDDIVFEAKTKSREPSKRF